MQLAPRYGADPVITLDGPPSAIAAPAIRQRRRLAEVLATFTEEQWSAPSRCEGWSARDVIVHLDTVNSFWSFSIGAGLRGEPTRFLATFDPVASPAQMVAEAADVPTDQVLARFTASTEALTDLWAGLDDDGWSALAEAPPGHLGVDVLTHHALWDSWIHERDILLPLGVSPTEEADEIAACLRYVAALGPAFAATQGSRDRGVLAVEVTDPEVAFTVEAGERVQVRTGPPETEADLRLGGGAVDLLEALSIRAPLAQPVPAASAWLLGGLAQVFDVA